MTPADLALLLIAFASVLVIIDAVVVLWRGPDPDLAPMATCGVRGCPEHRR